MQSTVSRTKVSGSFWVQSMHPQDYETIIAPGSLVIIQRNRMEDIICLIESFHSSHDVFKTYGSFTVW